MISKRPLAVGGLSMPITPLIEFSSPALSKGKCVVTSFKGTEHISSNYRFEASLYSDQSLPLLDDIVGQTATFTLMSSDGLSRPIHGVIDSIRVDADNAKGMTPFHLTIVPWFECLAMTSDSRIFQGKTVLEIVKICLSPFDITDYDDSLLTKTYDPLPMCVQYKESTLNFLQRLLEESEIGYFYKHTENSHTLVFFDDIKRLSLINADVRYTPTPHTKTYLRSWNKSQKISPNTSLVYGYDLRQPKTTISGSMSQSQLVSIFGKTDFTVMDYINTVKTNDIADKEAKALLYRLSLQQHLIRASGNIPTLEPGKIFQLSEHPDDDTLGNYVVYKIDHIMVDTSHTTDKNHQRDYQCSLVCFSSDVPFVPERSANSLKLDDIYLAEVVGPEKNTVHTDEFGRIKVKFKWEKNSDTADTSCWVRVTQLTAGTNMGTQFIPRVGDEVLISFIDGDPQKPLLMGSLYNEDNREPYLLPKQQALSGIKTRTLGKNAKKGHELRFDDTKNNEKFVLSSSGNIDITAKDDWTTEVKGKRTVQVKGNRLVEVQQGSAVIKTKEAIFNAGGTKLILDGSGIRVAAGTPVNVVSQSENSGLMSGDNSSSIDVVNNIDDSVKNVLPMAEMKINTGMVKVPPFLSGAGYIVNIHTTVSSLLTLKSKKSIIESNFNEEEFKLKAYNKSKTFFTDLKVKSFNARNLQLTIGNSYDNYTCSLTPIIDTPVKKHYTASVSQEDVLYSDSEWEISGSVEVQIDVDMDRKLAASAIASGVILTLVQAGRAVLPEIIDGISIIAIALV